MLGQGSLGRGAGHLLGSDSCRSRLAREHQVSVETDSQSSSSNPNASGFFPAFTRSHSAMNRLTVDT